MLIACAAWAVGMAQESYTVEILPADGGVVTSDKATAIEGETVTLTLTPASFYELEELVVESELIGGGVTDDDAWGPALVPAYIQVATTIVSEGVYTFVMPASKVKVMATFAPILIGDVDGDGDVGIADVTAIIDRILTHAPYLERADVDRNGMVTIADVTTLIDIILHGNQ